MGGDRKLRRVPSASSLKRASLRQRATTSRARVSCELVKRFEEDFSSGAKAERPENRNQHPKQPSGGRCAPYLEGLAEQRPKARHLNNMVARSASHPGSIHDSRYGPSSDSHLRHPPEDAGRPGYLYLTLLGGFQNRRVALIAGDNAVELLQFIGPAYRYA